MLERLGTEAINLHFALDTVRDIIAKSDAAGVPTPNEIYEPYEPIEN